MPTIFGCYCFRTKVYLVAAVVTAPSAANAMCLKGTSNNYNNN